MNVSPAAASHRTAMALIDAQNPRCAVASSKSMSAQSASPSCEVRIAVFELDACAQYSSRSSAATVEASGRDGRQETPDVREPRALAEHESISAVAGAANRERSRLIGAGAGLALAGARLRLRGDERRCVDQQRQAPKPSSSSRLAICDDRPRHRHRHGRSRAASARSRSRRRLRLVGVHCRRGARPPASVASLARQPGEPVRTPSSRYTARLRACRNRSGTT